MTAKYQGKKRAVRSAQARERVERLEDRILLAAQPLLLAATDSGSAGAVELVTLDPTQSRAPQASAFDALAGVATFVDLGQGAQQSSLLSADAADPSLLRLNDQLTFLVLDLGSGNNAAVLSSAGDGKLRLSGASFNDIVFTRPSALLGIRGGSGVDSLSIESVDIGSGSLEVETETISLGRGQTLSAGQDVLLRAGAAALQVQGSSAALDLLARVSIEGTLRAGAQVSLDASVRTDVRLSSGDSLAYGSIQAKTKAEAVIGSQASVQASGLSLTAHTYGRLQIVATDAASGSVTIDAAQATLAGVRDGAALMITGRSSGGAVDLLVEAVDQSRVATSLTTNDSLISSLSGFDLGLGQIKLQRNTQAYLGEVEGQGAARLSLSGPEGAALGRVQVSAASLDAPEGGVQGQVVSGLVGVQRNTVDDQVQAWVARADLTSSSLQVYALNASSLGADAKLASNQATGTTRALLVDSLISADRQLRLLATDLARFEASSAGFASDLSLLDSVSVGSAAASNTIERSLLARLENSTVQAGELLVVARSAATLTAHAQAMQVTGGGMLAQDFQLTMGGHQAWNQLLGQVEASVQRSSVTASSQGGVTVSAKNSTQVSAASVAGSVAVGDSALGVSLAFNAVGWRMGDMAASVISSLLGADLNLTELPFNTLAFVSGSDLQAAGAVSVTAVNAMDLDAVIVSRPEETAALGLLSFGAAAVLSSNRVRSDTKAYIERAAGSGAVVASGSVTVSAIDKADILADVSMRAVVPGVGLAVGGMVVRNDVRGTVAADLDGLSVLTAGDLRLEALASAHLAASLSGTVQAGSGSGFGASSLAANALIATNLVLGDAQAQVRGSTLTIDGSADMEARNASLIAADNQALTQSNGSAVGATLAFNTIGRQAQDLLSAGVDALLGASPAQEVPASVSASILGGSLQAAGNVSVTADASERVTARVSNAAVASGDGAAASLVLASNLVSARAQAFVRPAADAVAGSTMTWTAGGSVTLSASDSAAISADVSMGSNSAGGTAVGGVVVRNDVRNAVDARLERLNLSAGTDVSVRALGSANITAQVSGQTFSLGADSAYAKAFESSTQSLAVNALIATNLVLSSASATVQDSDLTVGGDLTVAADDAASITADNSASMSSSGAAIGLTLAFNTIGWQAQNLLFNAVDALLGTDIGVEQAASVSASMVHTAVAVAGNVVVSAGGQAADAGGTGQVHGAHLSATISNEVISRAESAAVSVLLASNKVSSRARAWISPLADRGHACSGCAGGFVGGWITHRSGGGPGADRGRHQPECEQRRRSRGWRGGAQRCAQCGGRRAGPGRCPCRWRRHGPSPGVGRYPRPAQRHGADRVQKSSECCRWIGLEQSHATVGGQRLDRQQPGPQPERGQRDSQRCAGRRQPGGAVPQRRGHRRRQHGSDRVRRCRRWRDTGI